MGFKIPSAKMVKKINTLKYLFDEYYYDGYGAGPLFMRYFNSCMLIYSKINYILQTFLWFELVTIPLRPVYDHNYGVHLTILTNSSV